MEAQVDNDVTIAGISFNENHQRRITARQLLDEPRQVLLHSGFAHE